MVEEAFRAHTHGKRPLGHTLKVEEAFRAHTHGRRGL